MTRRQFLALILPLLLILVGFGLVSILETTGAVGAPVWDDGFAGHVRRSLGYEYVGGLGGERKEWEAYFNALNAWVETFDIYAEIVPPWKLQAVREASSGQYVGIGVRTIRVPVEVKSPIESLEVTGVSPGGPAASAGVVVGDRILGVDGRGLREISSAGDEEEIAAAIKGPKGEGVSLDLRDEHGNLRTVEVVRDEVETGSVFGARMIDPEAGIGYIRLHAFMLDTARSFREDVKKLLEQGMKALVLDLRYDAGGILPQAIEVADAFLPSGVIVSVRGRGTDFSETYYAKKEGTISPDLPLAVLLNQGSASASEVLAGALRDHKRAVIVGERSWGKFLVQTVEEVPMEIGTVLFKRTTAIYVSPLGLSYQRRGRGHDPLAGLEPDLIVPTTQEEREIIGKIFNQEYFADWNPDAEPVHTDFEDRQIAAAAAILRGETYYPRLSGGAGE